MTKLERLWSVGLAALLALTIVFVWPPVDPGSASPYSHGVTSGPHGHHDHIEQNDRHTTLHADLRVGCDASMIDCCLSSHCNPGITVAPLDVSRRAGADLKRAASSDRGAGGAPKIVLPPPR